MRSAHHRSPQTGFAHQAYSCPAPRCVCVCDIVGWLARGYGRDILTKPVVLVTGGAGFIGSNIVDGLLRADCARVRVLDNFATGLRENLLDVRNDIELVEGDIRETETVEYAVEGVDCILHQAALPSVTRSVRAPFTTNDVNVGGTLNLLNAARKAGVQRFVMASSSSVYGGNQELPKHEGLAPNPLSPYAVSKLAAEHYCRVYASLYGIETIALRYFNVFGPRQDPRSQYSGVISRFMTAALEGEPYTVYGDGTQSRDFTFVDNVVAANLATVKAKALPPGPVNIACGARATLLNLVECINRVSGTHGQVRFESSRLGDVPHSQANISLASKVLHYRPHVDLESGLKTTFAWYAAQSRTQRSDNG